MATRENQGLQIALILMVLLVVALAVTSFVFYSQAQRFKNDAERANAELETQTTAFREADFERQSLRYMITGGATSIEALRDDLADMPGLATTSQEMQALQQRYEANMALIQDVSQTSVDKLNYETLVDHLVAVVNNKEKNYADEQLRANQLTAEKNQIMTSEAERSAQFEQGQERARRDLTTERTTFNAERERIDEEKRTIASQLATKDEQIVSITDAARVREEELEDQIERLEETVLGQKLQIQGLTTTSFEVPDARVTAVNQRLQSVYIDVGSADGLRPQQTFSVYSHGTSGVMEADAKGSIEVVEILDDHLARCRILDDDSGDIIVPGDIVHTPAWAPGQRVHIAIAGVVDVNGDGVDDRPLVVSLIELNGGVVDDVVTTQTRYLILGELTGARPELEPTIEERNSFNTMVQTATQIGVTQLSPELLLQYMGWKGDVRTVPLGSGANPEDFGPSGRRGSASPSTGRYRDR